MLIVFFLKLRTYGVPCSVTELLDLLKALEAELVFADMDAFYHLARLCLVKDERNYDKFERAFADYFEGIIQVDPESAIPKEWLLAEFIRSLSEEEKAALEAFGGLEALLKKFQERLAEQKERHAGGNKWIGTGGSSAFGAYGFHPEGIRVGQAGSGARRAVKVWDKREFAEFDDKAELNHRALQLALRQLRRFARTGAATELDLEGTIRASAQKGGWLDLQFKAERHNAVKILILFDIGGSMDDYIHESEQLFLAARAEFKHLEFFYFHNCVYETLWRSAKRRQVDALSTLDFLRTYGSDYKLLIIGDATMGPYEITYPGGSVEHFNQESGAVWLGRLFTHFNFVAWLNPQPKKWWSHYTSIGVIQDLMQQKMADFSLAGLQQAITWLSKKTQG